MICRLNSVPCKILTNHHHHWGSTWEINSINKKEKRRTYRQYIKENLVRRITPHPSRLLLIIYCYHPPPNWWMWLQRIRCLTVWKLSVGKTLVGFYFTREVLLDTMNSLWVPAKSLCPTETQWKWPNTSPHSSTIKKDDHLYSKGRVTEF